MPDYAALNINHLATGFKECQQNEKIFVLGIEITKKLREYIFIT